MKVEGKKIESKNTKLIKSHFNIGPIHGDNGERARTIREEGKWRLDESEQREWERTESLKDMEN